MTTELMMLAYSTALLFVLIVIQVLVAVRAVGLIPLANHRDNLPDPKPFQARTKRIVDNHREGLMLFAPLALIVAVAHLSSPITALGAQMFFYARVVHAGLYLAGVPLIRPLAWAVGIAGCVMQFGAILHWW